MVNAVKTCEVCGKPVEDNATLCLEHRPIATKPQYPDLPEGIEITVILDAEALGMILKLTCGGHGHLPQEEAARLTDTLVLKCSDPDKLNMKITEHATGMVLPFATLTGFRFTISTKFAIAPEGFAFEIGGHSLLLKPGKPGEWEQWYSPDKTLEDLVRDSKKRPQDIDPLPRFMELANSTVYYRTREIIAHGDFARNGGERWPTGYIRRGDLSADVQIKPDPATVEPYLAEEDLIGWQEKAADIALEMDDETADVLDYITYEVVNQANNPEQDVTFSAHRFSQLRGIQKQKAGDGHRGGYKTEYRRDFAREVEKLGTTWIRVAEMEVIEPDEKGKRRRSKKRGLESRAIVVSTRAGQLNLGGRIEPDSYRGRLGPLFAASVFGVWRQTALVSIKALGYDPYRQLPEKRLTRYLSWQWRIRQGFGNYLQPYEVATLLEAAGMKISKNNPTQTKERLEKALETLTTDGIVSGWQYGEGWNEEIVGKRGWAAQWKDWRIVVEPPQEILDHYKTIPVMEQKTPKALPANGETIGARLQAALADLGHTQLQAAEDIGINQATLSRVIRGKNPAPAIRKKIVTWLDNLHSQKPNNQA